MGGVHLGARGRGLRRFDHYAKTQRWIWTKAKALAEEHDLGEAIDVIADALALYETHLKDKVEASHATA